MTGNNAEIILFAHGSSLDSANDAVREVARQMAAAGGYHVEAAFLMGGSPELPDAVAAAAQRTRRIVIVPYFLTVGTHIQRDLTALVSQARAAHPNLSIEVAPTLDGHAGLIDILLSRAASFMNGPTQ